MATTDRRTKYTKTVVRQALFDLLKEKPLAKITVTDICKLADINRSTFYSYYEDVSDLLNQIQNDVFENVVFSLTTDNWFDDLLNLVDNNRDLFQILIGPHGDSSFIRQLLYLGYDNSMRAWAKMYPSVSATYFDYAYAYLANGIIGMLENWVCSDYKESIEEVGRMILGVSTKGMDFLEECAKLDAENGHPTKAE